MQHDRVLVTHGTTQVVKQPLGHFGDETEASRGVFGHKLEEGSRHSWGYGGEVQGKNVNSAVVILVHIPADSSNTLTGCLAFDCCNPRKRTCNLLVVNTRPKQVLAH